MVTAGVDDLPCFTAFLFFGPYSLLKFKIHNFYLYLFVYFFCNIIVIMNLWIPHIKWKKAPGMPNNISAVSRHVRQLNRWQVTLLFCFNYSHVLPINHRYIQKIVRATILQSMNVRVQSENYGKFPLCN